MTKSSAAPAIKRSRCSECSRSFKDNSKLQRHIREAHSAQQKHQCSVCGRIFRRLENLQRHLRNKNVHKHCSVCGRKDFQNHLQLQRHRLTSHTEQRERSVKNANFIKWEFSINSLDKLPKEDPKLLDDDILTEYPLEYRELIAENWSWIKTKHVRKNIVSTFNLRLPPKKFTVSSVADFLRSADSIQTQAYKIQIVFGYVYRVLRSYADPTEEEEFSEPSYFRPQKPTVANTGYLPDGPWTVARSEHLEDLIERLDTDDIVEHLNLRRPSTKHVVEIVSNVMLYVYKMENPIIGSCCQDGIPRYLAQKRCVRTMWHRNSRKEPWPDSKCGFRCVAADRILSSGIELTEKNLSVETEKLFLRYSAQNNLIDSSDFNGGLTLDQLSTMESSFEIGIFVYELVLKSDPDRLDTKWKTASVVEDNQLAAVLRRKPSELFEKTLYLDLCNAHFSLITDIEQYCSSFLCGQEGCSMLFNDKSNCSRHEQICGIGRKRKILCTGGGYEPALTLFDQLDSVGIPVPESDRYMDMFCSFDCEAYSTQIPHDLQLHGANTRYESELVLASISVCSSVPGFQEAKFFLSNGDPQELTDRFVQYISEISLGARELLEKRLEPVFEKLDFMLEKEMDRACLKQLNRLRELLERRTKRLHVFGWNSRGFDVPMLRLYLMKCFADRGWPVLKLIKKQNSYLMLEVERLKFLDMQSMIAPHASYDGWLQSLKIEGLAKSRFPFTWFDSLEKLSETQLPDRELWRNDLKNTPLTDSEWAGVVGAWNDRNMTTMKDFLEYYNNCDVNFFIQGIDIQREFWKGLGICMICDGISLSGLSLKIFDKHLGPDTYISLPQKDDYYFIRTLRKSICGGLAQVFHRIHIADVTRLKGSNKLCKTIEGYDFNSLYLTELGMEMPFGVPFEWRRSEESGRLFNRRTMLPKSVSLAELEWLSWESWRRKVRIRHYLSCRRQFRVGESNYRVDGALLPNLLFEFHGCRWHGHGFDDPWCSHSNSSAMTEQEMSDRREYTAEKIDFLRGRGYSVIEMMSCEWEKLKRNNPAIRSYLFRRFYPKYYSHFKGAQLTQAQLLEAMRNGQIFGLAMVDIHTPEHLKEKFRDMQPLIFNREIQRSDLGSLMQEYCEKNDLLKKPRRVLAQSYSGRNLLLITPLLTWYMNKGLVVSKLHWVREFRSDRAFKPLSDQVLHFRKQADIDPSMELQGNSFKLAGNSIYGKTLQDGSNYTDIRIVDDEGLKKTIAKPAFRSAETLGDGIHEVETARRRVAETNPLIIGFSILQYSKLRMLKFYYDFLDRFLLKDTWAPLFMDTDSMYLALSEDSLDALADPEKKEEYLRCKSDYLVTSVEQKREGGLMKLENKGSGCIALAPKTHIVFDKTWNKLKKSHKGAQASNKLTPRHYYRVLKSQKKHLTTNRGLWYKEKRFVRYKQLKSGLPYLLLKKRTHSDGITLSPLPEPSDGALDAIIDHSSDENE